MLRLLAIRGVDTDFSFKHFKSLANRYNIKILDVSDQGTFKDDIYPEIDNKISSETIISIFAHGNSYDGDHIIRLVRGIDYTSDLLANINSVAKGIPLQIYLESCFSGNFFLENDPYNRLHDESIVVTSSKSNRNSVGGLFDKKYFSSNSFFDEKNPYISFAKQFHFHAAQYGRFVTNSGVFEITPDYTMLTNDKYLKSFLQKGINRFIEFSKTHTWNGRIIAFPEINTSDRKIKLFSEGFFIYSCAINEEGFVNFLENNIGNKNIVSLFNTNNFNGLTPIYIASFMGHIGIVRLLITGGADPNLLYKNEASPLFIATQQQNIEVVKLLIEGGANPNSQRENGATPLLVSVEVNDISLTKILLDSGANVNLPEKKGMTPLSRASEKGYTNTVALLLLYKADPDLVDQNGISPLSIAVENGNARTVELLLVSGADPDLVDKEGITPILCASIKGYAQIAGLLIQYGANINLVDNMGRRPLLEAHNNNHQEIKIMLLKKSYSDLQLLVKSEGHITENDLLNFPLEVIQKFVSFVESNVCGNSKLYQWFSSLFGYSHNENCIEVEDLIILKDFLLGTHTSHNEL